jgi:hypothetical protein
LVSNEASRFTRLGWLRGQPYRPGRADPVQHDHRRHRRVLIGWGLSDRTGRRKVFIITASIVYGPAMFLIAAANHVNGSLVGMAINELRFGMYMAVDLALAVDVLPDTGNDAKDLGVWMSPATFPAPSRRLSWRCRQYSGKGTSAIMS